MHVRIQYKLIYQHKYTLSELGCDLVDLSEAVTATVAVTLLFCLIYIINIHLI